MAVPLDRESVRGGILENIVMAESMQGASGGRASFVVGLTGDGVSSDGSSIHGSLGLDRLNAAGLSWTPLPDPAEPAFLPALARVDSVVSFGHAHFADAELEAVPRLQHIARFGAGHDTIDLEACTAHGVAVTNTPTAVRRPLALAGLTMLLSLAHNVMAKDRITRCGQWEQRAAYRGRGLHGRTVGILGFGGVGAELAELAQPLGVRVIGANSSGRSEAAARLGVPLVSVRELAQNSDFLVLTAALTSKTRNIVDETVISQMNESAFLINIGRGGLVDQDALRSALRDGAIAGAGLDVFEPEPIDPADPLLSMDNVLLAPHSLCWTEDFTADVSASVLAAVIDVAYGRRPQHLVNSDVWSCS